MKRAVVLAAVVAALCICLAACTGEQGEVREKYALLGYDAYDVSPEDLGLDDGDVDFVYRGVKGANTSDLSIVTVITFKGLDDSLAFEEVNADVLPNLIRRGRAVVFGDVEAVEAY